MLPEQQTRHYPIPSPDSLHYPGPKPRIDKTTNRPITNKSLVKIPQSVLAQAKGIAIFTSFRTGGPQIGGAGGSGIVMVRLPDGSWSPPSGILPNNLSVGFMLGFDVYDCVCVLNTTQAVDAFTKRARFSLGGDIAMVAGPVGVGAQLDADVNFKGGAATSQPVWCYVKSRGFYAGASVDGTIIIERPDANGMFYGEKKIRPEKILRGDVVARPYGTLAEDGSRMWPEGAARLMDVVRDAEGAGRGQRRRSVER
ncbi:uncharacterized protein B0I36DRAFT_335137 [Microdochium trichocladiopsis]|uniref:Ysc84 actin-binding domain-containing protein n=1 Tax=Microdochium trichocladiopsis TaxID=1682393 RepID=A0A9P8XU84_9PEZI|nr:uncharacterized protein B0I36DRAFT_335137 [Microdochium trichocladiopsis]KAH7017995.1 hypothetical protein B0I36DRAFT_335137 [Microdochium trichocladiopsis]